MFPIEAGDINPENRIIPHLPGEGLSYPGGLLVLALLTCLPRCPPPPLPLPGLDLKKCAHCFSGAPSWSVSTEVV